MAACGYNGHAVKTGEENVMPCLAHQDGFRTFAV